jgi:hypothetical protein
MNAQVQSPTCCAASKNFSQSSIYTIVAAACCTQDGLHDRARCSARRRVHTTGPSDLSRCVLAPASPQHASCWQPAPRSSQHVFSCLEPRPSHSLIAIDFVGYSTTTVTTTPSSRPLKPKNGGGRATSGAAWRERCVSGPFSRLALVASGPLRRKESHDVMLLKSATMMKRPAALRQGAKISAA